VSARSDGAKVRAILHGEWDPIGAAVPEDEYDSYVWPVLVMLMRRADRAEVEDYLRWAADDAMASPVPEDRLARVIDALMALEVEFRPAMQR
jgi:DNA-binding NarL/FixJ family response regulator